MEPRKSQSVQEGKATKVMPTYFMRAKIITAIPLQTGEIAIVVLRNMFTKSFQMLSCRQAKWNFESTVYTMTIRELALLNTMCSSITS